MILLGHVCGPNLDIVQTSDNLENVSKLVGAGGIWARLLVDDVSFCKYRITCTTKRFVSLGERLEAMYAGKSDRFDRLALLSDEVHSNSMYPFRTMAYSPF